MSGENRFRMQPEWPVLNLLSDSPASSFCLVLISACKTVICWSVLGKKEAIFCPGDLNFFLLAFLCILLWKEWMSPLECNIWLKRFHATHKVYLASSQPLNSIDLLDVHTSRKIICKFLFGISSTMRLCSWLTIITKFILFMKLQDLMSRRGVSGYESKSLSTGRRIWAGCILLVLKFDPGICLQY